MARHHDVVSVTVNHRLNLLGFLDMSSIGGPAYADSVNVGMTDLVAALRWVRENIANFGGDPDSRHDLRPVGRRLQGDHSTRDALGGGTDPPRVGAIGRRRQSSRRRGVQRVRQAGDRRARRQGHRGAPEDGMGQVERGQQCRCGQDEPAGGRRWADPGAGHSQTAGRSGADRRRPPDYDAVLLRCRAGDFEERAAVVRLGERGRELDAFPADGSRVAATLTRNYGEAKAKALVGGR